MLQMPPTALSGVRTSPTKKPYSIGDYTVASKKLIKGSGELRGKSGRRFSTEGDRLSF
jgi:hypothetical protein